MMTKEKFVSILNQLEAGENLQQTVASAVRRYNNFIHSDYPEPFGMVILHDYLVMDLLEEIMDDRLGDISYFCIEMEFGKNYSPGSIVNKDGTEIDLSTADKLYDYLVEQKEKGSIND